MQVKRPIMSPRRKKPLYDRRVIVKTRRMKTNVKRNTAFYRNRKLLSKLVSDPFKYYIYQKLKYYPYVYSRHYEIKKSKSPRNTVPSRVSTSSVPLLNDGGGTSGIASTTYSVSPSFPSTSKKMSSSTPVSSRSRSFFNASLNSLSNLFSGKSEPEELDGFDDPPTLRLISESAYNTPIRTKKERNSITHQPKMRLEVSPLNATPSPSHTRSKQHYKNL